MIQFQIQSDSDIPVSKQLFDQLQFAIASRQYAPGHRLPSTRQLAKMTGLHRNTISKVYRQLEETGLVNSLAGSGIYVKKQESENETLLGESPLLQQYPHAQKIIKDSINQLIAQGCSLTQARELFLGEIEWRLRCSALVLVTVPEADMGLGKLMVSELEQALLIPVQLVPMEELSYVLEQTTSATVVTSRYFLREVLEITSPKSIRVIPVDIYDYHKELQLIKKLPQDCCIGIVSLSLGILRVAEILIHSLHGNKLWTMTAQTNDRYKLNVLVRSAHTIITDPASHAIVKKAVQDAREDLIRPPQIIRSDNYIGENSLHLLKRELGQPK
jgi:GntR family transcriptional regulator